jgi:signal transduction histidine kinase
VLLMNLILNALDVTEKGGKIEVSVAPVGGFLEIEVRDHGPGIPDHILPHIFDPFFTTKARGKGTGLGLAISQGIVQKHGGELRVETAVGEGTRFTVSLPVTDLPMDFAAIGFAGEAGPRP